MGLASSVAIAAAERVERTGGARAGLAVWRTVAESAVDVETRATALLAAMRCALDLRDPAALEVLALGWERVQSGFYDEVFARIRRAAAAGLVPSATSIARAEAARLRSARGLYAYARCLELSGDVRRAEQIFREAIARAEKEGVLAVASAARLHRAVLLALSLETAREALEEARRVDPGSTSPRDKLALARILLRSSSRFVRAGAIDLLDPLVTGTDAVLQDASLALLAEHADDAGDDLTPMEADRLLALFARPSVEKKALRARQALEVVAAFARARSTPEATRDAAVDDAIARAARLDPALAQLHARARDLTSGRFEPHAAFELPRPRTEGEEAWRDAWAAVLDLAFAMRDGAFPRAALVLRQLRAHALAEGGRFAIPIQVWSPLVAALASADEEVRGAALDLASVLLASRARKAPPRGWLPVSAALTGAGREDLGELARRAAVQSGEPGAAEALAIALTRSAWQLARQPEPAARSRALALLREARAIASTTGGSPSPPARSPAAPSPPPSPPVTPEGSGPTPSP